MADAADSKSVGSDVVWVQVPPSAQKELWTQIQGSFSLEAMEKLCYTEPNNQLGGGVTHEKVL